MQDRLNQYDINEGILECSNRSPANKEKEHQIAPCSNTLRNVNEGHQEGTDDRRRDAANSVQEHRLVQDSLTSSDKIEVLQDRGRRDSHEGDKNFFRAPNNCTLFPIDDTKNLQILVRGIFSGNSSD
jgi:hypothetical protein